VTEDAMVPFEHDQPQIHQDAELAAANSST
jgi:hypothetical protein